MLRQLEAILSIHKLARAGCHLDALREVAKLPFLPLDPRAPDIANDVFQNLSAHVQACVPDVLKVALHCLDNLTDSDGSLRALRTKVCLAIQVDLSFCFHCLIWVPFYFSHDLWLFWTCLLLIMMMFFHDETLLMETECLFVK